MPPYQDWDSFTWETVDGGLVPKLLQPPVDAEPPRGGKSSDNPRPTCAASAPTPAPGSTNAGS